MDESEIRITGGGPEAIVAACEIGEDSAEAAFERVVNRDVAQLSGDRQSV